MPERREAARRSGSQGPSRLALSLLLALALGGCADLAQFRGGSPQADALLSQTPADIPERVSLDDVPFFPQDEFQCGPAALATVLNHMGLAVTPQALAPQVYTPEREGSLQVELLASARRQGALAVRVTPRLDALLRELTAGRPVLVLLNPGLAAWPRWHYAVVVGHDLKAGTVTMRSGAERVAVWPLRTFDFAWARGARWGVVVTPPEQPPATAARGDLLDAVTALARVQPAAASRKAYTAALALRPDDAVLELGLAQTWADQQAWAEAIQVLESAVAHGGGAVALNNLAMAWWQAGDAQRARQVAEQALARARDREPAWLSTVEDTLRQVQGPVPTSAR